MSKKEIRFKSFRHIPGIYCIINITNQKRYIGHTANMSKRFQRHRTALRGGYHPNDHLQHAWTLYGESVFHFVLLERVESKELLTKREQFWMEKYNVLNDQFGYNVCPQANKSAMSQETKQKISNTKKGVPMREDTKRKLSLAKRGKKTGPPSPEHLAIMKANAKARRGIPLSLETRKKISESKKGQPSWNKGKPLPERQKEILRQYRLKNPAPTDPKTGRFISS